MPSKGRPYTTTCKGEKVWVLAHSICLLEQEAESLPTFCSDIELLAQSKSKAIPERFCLRGSLTEAYLNSLYGTTLQRSGTTTQTHEAILNGSEKGAGNSSFVAGYLSLAKTYQSPEAGPDWTAKGQGYGEKWLGLLGKYDPDSCSLKTAQLSLLEDSTGCCPTLPRWGLLAVGASLEPMTLGQCTSENESGFSGAGNGKQDAKTHKGFSGLVLSAVWNGDEKRSVSIWSIDGFGPIYEAEILLDGLPERFFSERRTEESPKQVAFSLPEKGMLRALFFAREFASSSQGQGHPEQLTDEFADALRELSQQAALAGAQGKWKIVLNGELFPQPMLVPFTVENESGFSLPTPCATDAGSGRFNTSVGSDNKRPTLAMMAKRNLWPTPTTQDNVQIRGKGAAANAPTRGATLAGAVKMFPTATATASKGWSKNHNRANSDDRLDYTIEREAHQSGVTGRLNPEFCEWLMGWPIGHTDLKPSATGRFQEWWQQHGSCFMETRGAA